MGRCRLLAALAAALAALPGGGGAQVRPGAALQPSAAQQARMERETLLFAPERGPRLLKERLRISGIEPDDVARTLEAYNRRSEILQFTPEGVALAPHVLDRALALDPGQLLQVRFSGQSAKLVFRMTWR